MILVENKKARMKYQVLATYNAGLELLGSEVKSLRNKLGSLEGARVVVRGGEAYLLGATIPPYQHAGVQKDYDAVRTRKLLLKKSEIQTLADAESTKGLTTVPLSVYNGRHLKLTVAIVRGKGKADRREDIKKRDAKREAARVLRRK